MNYKFLLFTFLSRRPAAELDLTKLVTELMDGPIDLDYKKTVE
jgi:hypothetical protein